MPKKAKKEVSANKSKQKKKLFEKNKTKEVESRSFKRTLKARKKEFFRALLVLFILLIIYFISVFIFQLRSVYTEQIIMETNPQYIFLNTRQGEKENISIETEIRTSFFCETICNYSFKDLSSGEILEENSVKVTTYKSHLFETVLSTNSLGTGQELYLFEIGCRIQDSGMCSSTRFPVVRNSLVTLNYGLSKDQQAMKDEVLRVINDITSLLSVGETNILSAEATTNSFNYMKTSHLELEATSLKFFSNVLKKDVETINEFWKTKNFSFVLEEISKRNVLEKAIYFKESSDELIELIELEKEIHNSAVILLEDLEQKIPRIEELRRASVIANILAPNQSLYDLYNNTLLLNKLLVEKNFDSYQELTPLIDDTRTLMNYLIVYYEEELLEKTNLFYEASIWASLLRNDLCLIREENCNELVNFPNNNFSEVPQILDYSDTLCLEIQGLKELKEPLVEQQEEVRKELSAQELSAVDKEKLLVESSMIHWQIQRLSDNQVLAKSILKNYSIEILNDTFQDPNYYPDFYDETKRIGFLPANYLENDSDYFFDACIFELFDFPETKTRIEEEDLVFVLAPKLDVLEELPATCCFDSECEDCCDSWDCKEDLRNPLILLHGYSFYSFNSAFHSTNAYNDFVSFVLDEGLYYPAGILGPAFYPDYEKHDLTRNFVPPVFKLTYYDVLRFEEIKPGELNIKSQNIEDYGDKLNELILFVKNVTGKEKIDVIAHSMGGLVTRSYIDKYGDDSLGKIVFVGTPNKGVPRRLLHLCKFFGGQTECEEMYEKSAFMDYLNYEATHPRKEVHMIVGDGCSTFGADGDGVVQKRSAELEYAENHYFTGSCELIDNFHRDMIKPSKYPEIYDLIISLLLS